MAVSPPALGGVPSTTSAQLTLNFGSAEVGVSVLDLDMDGDLGRVPSFLEPEWDEDRRVDDDLDLMLDLVLDLEGRSFAFGRPDFP
ncbi:hypothetical protein HPB50_005578 [Hyalomma asiaticum]|uniref:Uncharacterized protein n=1 Tax=Hyalomma asiaticum TaxID=266040 RepID=A0ACB7TEU5_HYAAI|nr:hypothetical protein HPB50_005578 [Hyalomma asiaticum]